MSEPCAPYSVAGLVLANSGFRLGGTACKSLLAGVGGAGAGSLRVLDLSGANLGDSGGSALGAALAAGAGGGGTGVGGFLSGLIPGGGGGGGGGEGLIKTVEELKLERTGLGAGGTAALAKGFARMKLQHSNLRRLSLANNGKAVQVEHIRLTPRVESTLVFQLLELKVQCFQAIGFSN